MFEGVTVCARKRLLIGIILMCGLLAVYEYFTVGFVNIGVFRVFLPVFWAAFSIVAMFAMGTNPEKTVDRYYQRKNRLIISICNLVTLVMMGYVYFTFNKTDMDVDYWSSRSVYTTLIICLLVLFYMFGAFKDFKVSPTNMIKYPYPNPSDTGDLAGGKACDISDKKDDFGEKDIQKIVGDGPKTPEEAGHKPLSDSEIEALRVLNSGDKYAKEMNKCLGRKAGFMVTPVVLDDVKEEKVEETLSGDELMDAMMEDAVVEEEKQEDMKESSEKSKVSFEDTESEEEDEDETETTALDDAE